MLAVSERGRARTEAQSRCDGVGSESSRRKPSQRSMTPGLTGPLRAEGFPVDGRKLLLVELPSGGFGRNKREASPGCFCPAFLVDAFGIDDEAQPRTLSIRAAFHTGMPPRREMPEIL
jgi:hypothetical protein